MKKDKIANGFTFDSFGALKLEALLGKNVSVSVESGHIHTGKLVFVTPYALVIEDLGATSVVLRNRISSLWMFK